METSTASLAKSAPRIYGKDLTAFDLATSGKLSLTVQDTRALDIDRNSNAAAVTITTIDNDSLFLSTTNSSNASVQLGTTGVQITGLAHDIYLNSSSNSALSVYSDSNGDNVVRISGKLGVDGAIAFSQDSVNFSNKEVIMAYPAAGSNGAGNTESGLRVYGEPESPAFTDAPRASTPRKPQTRATHLHLRT